MNCPHCEIEISVHPASRCLDAWVSEAVMRMAMPDFVLPYISSGPVAYCMTPKIESCLDYLGKILLPYSTDIAAAWPVLEKAEIHTLRRIVNPHDDDADSWWQAMVFLDPSTWGEAPALELAICRAAIKASNAS